MHYTERIRALREDHDLTQKQIASILYVGQTVYSSYEINKIRIPLDSMIVLAKFYNVDLNYIFGVSGQKRPFPRD